MGLLSASPIISSVIGRVPASGLDMAPGARPAAQNRKENRTEQSTPAAIYFWSTTCVPTPSALSGG
eukprot:scaffold18472_cov101-Isochrysis_galbana.AAC.6